MGVQKNRMPVEYTQKISLRVDLAGSRKKRLPFRIEYL